MKRLAFLVVCMAATPAAAVDHWQDCSALHEVGEAVSSDKLFLSASGGKKTLCYDTDGTADSAVIATGSCDHLDVLVFNMTDTSTDKAVTVLSCSNPTCLGSFIVENVTLSGNATDDTETIQGFGADWIKVDWTTNTGSDDMRVMVRCNKL